MWHREVQLLVRAYTRRKWQSWWSMSAFWFTSEVHINTPPHCPLGFPRQSCLLTIHGIPCLRPAAVLQAPLLQAPTITDHLHSLHRVSRHSVCPSELGVVITTPAPLGYCDNSQHMHLKGMQGRFIFIGCGSGNLYNCFGKFWGSIY